MIHIPDNILLIAIQERNIYCDEMSVERSTGRQKKKYKLSRGDILGIYLFNVLMGEIDACNKRITSIIKCRDDLEDRVSGYLAGEHTYCDVSKLDSITKDEILAKMRDARNGFIYVAKVTSKKYKEIGHLTRVAADDPTMPPAKHDFLSKCAEKVLEDKINELGI